MFESLERGNIWNGLHSGKRRMCNLVRRCKEATCSEKNGVIIRLFRKNVSQMENYRYTGFSKTSTITLMFSIKANMKFQRYRTVIKSSIVIPWIPTRSPLCIPLKLIKCSLVWKIHRSLNKCTKTQFYESYKGTLR